MSKRNSGQRVQKVKGYKRSKDRIGHRVKRSQSTKGQGVQKIKENKKSKSKKG